MNTDNEPFVLSNNIIDYSRVFLIIFDRARYIQEGFDPNDVPYASFKSMSDHLNSSMIQGAEIQTKQLTEGFHEHHSIFFFKFQMVFQS